MFQSAKLPLYQGLDASFFNPGLNDFQAHIPLFNFVCYNMVLYAMQFKEGSKKCIDN